MIEKGKKETRLMQQGNKGKVNNNAGMEIDYKEQQINPKSVGGSVDHLGMKLEGERRRRG